MDNYTFDEKTILREIAFGSIANGFSKHEPLDINTYNKKIPEKLLEKKATFVTLEINNNLRGCIGTLEPIKPLILDISHNAYSAAFADPRFEPMVKHEFDSIDLYISILTEPKNIEFNSEEELLSKIKPNIDGVILEDKGHRGTFLPSVWEQLPDPKQFLQHLKNKAGLSADYWSDTIKVKCYNTIYI